MFYGLNDYAGYNEHVFLDVEAVSSPRTLPPTPLSVSVEDPPRPRAVLQGRRCHSKVKSLSRQNRRKVDRRVSHPAKLSRGRLVGEREMQGYGAVLSTRELLRKEWCR